MAQQYFISTQPLRFPFTFTQSDYDKVMITSATGNVETANLTTAQINSLGRQVRTTGVYGNVLELSNVVAVGNVTSTATIASAAFAGGAGTASAPTFSFTGDTNTGMWSPGADVVALSTGGTERMRIDLSGRVGIGTVAPATGNALHVVGNALVSGRVLADRMTALSINGTSPAFVQPSKMLDAVWGGAENTFRALGALEMSQIAAVADVSGSLNNTYFTISAPPLTSTLVDYTVETSAQYTVWFNVNGEGVQPTVASTVIYVPVPLATNSTDTMVASAISTALSAYPTVFKIGTESATVRIVAQRPGPLTDINAGTSGMVVSVLTTGSGSLGAVTTKYSGAVTGPNGKVYLIPNSSTNVGIVDPSTGTIDTTTISGLSSATGKWQDGVLAGGKIFCVPHTAATVLIIDCATDTAEETSITGLGAGNKWIGGALERTGQYIYCAPYDSTSVLIIDTVNRTANSTSISGLSGTSKWAGAVLAPNGRVYMVPHASTTVLIVDPVTNTAEQTSIIGLTGSTKWWGGCLAPNGKIYCTPSSSASMLIIDPSTNTADTTSITGLTTTGSKWRGSPVVAPNGKLYVQPHGNTNVLVVDPGTNTYAFIPGVGGANKYLGASLGPNGQILFAPYQARYVLVVDTGPQSLAGNVSLGGTIHASGSCTFKSIREHMLSFTGTTGVVVHDWSLGSIFYHTAMATDFTINATNVPVVEGRVTTLTLLLAQGETARMATAFQISGVTQTIRWQGGIVPTGNANRWDILTVSLVRIGAAWIVLAQSAPYG